MLISGIGTYLGLNEPRIFPHPGYPVPLSCKVIANFPDFSLRYRYGPDINVLLSP